jgi:hypothetical protein
MCFSFLNVCFSFLNVCLRFLDYIGVAPMIDVIFRYLIMADYYRKGMVIDSFLFFFILKGRLNEFFLE